MTTGTPSPEQKERRAAGNTAYWDSSRDAEQVFYGHVLGFKGLERRAVVPVVNEETAFERSRERLYVGTLLSCLVIRVSSLSSTSICSTTGSSSTVSCA